MQRKRPLAALVILDGWGVAPCTQVSASATAHAAKPCYEALRCNYPYTTLHASGMYVGLPEHVVGNSEVGHMTIGSGQRISQPLTLMNDLCRTGFATHPAWQHACTHLLQGGRLHIIQLISEGMVHSSLEHLHALLQTCAAQGISPFIHAILDGRDVSPRSAHRCITQVEAWCKLYGGTIASLSGRWFAMDRDEHTERTERMYTMLIGNTPVDTRSWGTLLEEHYATGATEETFPPTRLITQGRITDADVVIDLLLREDRARHLMAYILGQETLQLRTHSTPAAPFHSPAPRPQPACVISAIPYHPSFDIPFFVTITPPATTFIDDIAARNLRLYTTAETEKYAHVTYFFNGGREAIQPCETRVMIPSLPVASYDTAPRMSADALTRALCDNLETDPHDVYLINYANADMVGHSGNFEATVEAITCLDDQLRILHDEIVMKRGGLLCITADHGKAEILRDSSSLPLPHHSANMVPFICAMPRLRHSQEGIPLTTELADIRHTFFTLVDRMW